VNQGGGLEAVKRKTHIPYRESIPDRPTVTLVTILTDPNKMFRLTTRQT